MVACKKCLTENSLDSLFCRHCGEAIAGDERLEAKQKHEQLISEGYRIFNEGRTAEALLVAESTLAEDSRSTSALSLKGMCHERVGELAEALAAYERVVELNPDSALDKIKVTHLRQSISGKTLAEPVSAPRGKALLGAAAAVVLVVAVGVAIASNGSTPTRVAMTTVDPLTGTTDTFAGSELQQPAGNQAAGQETQAVTQPKPQPSPSQQPSSGGTVVPPPASGYRYGGTRPSVLPQVGGSELEGAIGPRPVTLAPPKNIQLTPEPSRGAEEGPDPKVGGPVTGNGIDVSAKPVEEQPIIEIKVSNPRPNTPGGSTPISDDNGAEALLKTANQQFLLGRFSQAASTYESALRAGASSGSTNQRIAQSYANLGNRDAAAAAYKRAISSYEASLSRGESPRTRSALESCRQALKVLGG